MNKIAGVTVAFALCFGALSVVHGFEEKTEIKTKKDGSYKMKVKRKGEHEYVGEYEGKTYTLRGHDFGPTFHEGSEYTVYGSLGDDYVTTTRVEPLEVRETVVTEPEEHWNMRVVHRGPQWYGVVGDKEYVLHGDHAREEGEFTVHGHMGKDNVITTTKLEHYHK